MTQRNKSQPFGLEGWQQSAPYASPLFRWAGGKRRFILGNAGRFPPFDGTFHEPFAGGLAVYFWLASKSQMPLKARISDTNLRLIRTYQEIKFEPKVVCEALEELIHGYRNSGDTSAYYYRVRDDFNATNPRGDAPRFMFLMATGWNGVYRTNSKGGFNVPFGNSDKAVKFPTNEDIFCASEVLKHADLRACSWETSLSAALESDFVFLDPPYLTGDHKDSNIYEKGKSFSFSDHERLAKELVVLKHRNVNFMLTNAYSHRMVEMYRDLGLTVDVVSSRRSINSKVDARGDEGELIVTAGSTDPERITNAVTFDLTMKLRKRGENR